MDHFKGNFAGAFNDHSSAFPSGFAEYQELNDKEKHELIVMMIGEEKFKEIFEAAKQLCINLLQVSKGFFNDPRVMTDSVPLWILTSSITFAFDMAKDKILEIVKTSDEVEGNENG